MKVEIAPFDDRGRLNGLTFGALSVLPIPWTFGLFMFHTGNFCAVYDSF